MAKEALKKEVTEVKAYARGIHISPKKVRLVVNLLKNMPVEQAQNTLKFLSKRAALPISKLIHSAISGAENNFQIDPDNLYIKSLTVDGGKVYFRYQPRAQGRALPVRKRTSHINLILGVRKKAGKVKKAAIQSAKPATFEQKLAEAKTEGTKPAIGPKKSRFGFFRRKKDSSVNKADVKGKSQTTFDRRGNM